MIRITEGISRKDEPGVVRPSSWPMWDWPFARIGSPPIQYATGVAVPEHAPEPATVAVIRRHKPNFAFEVGLKSTNSVNDVGKLSEKNSNPASFVGSR